MCLGPGEVPEKADPKDLNRVSLQRAYILSVRWAELLEKSPGHHCTFKFTTMASQQVMELSQQINVDLYFGNDNELPDGPPYYLQVGKSQRIITKEHTCLHGLFRSLKLAYKTGSK